MLWSTDIKLGLLPYFQIKGNIHIYSCDIPINAVLFWIFLEDWRYDNLSPSLFITLLQQCYCYCHCEFKVSRFT